MLYTRSSLSSKDVRIIVDSYNGGVVGKICIIIGTRSDDVTSKCKTNLYIGQMHMNNKISKQRKRERARNNIQPILQNL